MTPFNDSTATWILTAVVAALGTVLWWSIRGWIKGVNTRITEILGSLQIMGNKNVGFEKDIARLDKSIDSHDKRMHDYSERIREMEVKQAKCRNCTE